MINFSRSFDSAWERMVIILFKPFDLGKWFVIGFSAFLAGLLQGGNGLNGSYNSHFDDLRKGKFQAPKLEFHQIQSNLSHAFSGIETGLIIMFVLAVLVIGLALALLIYWIGARGQFLFLDNIVRNRGEISWPWQRYARVGNSLFLAYVVFIFLGIALIVPFAVVGILLALPLFQHHRWPVDAEIYEFVFFGLAYFIVALAVYLIIFLFREFGVPLMFRHELSAREAFVETVNVVTKNLGSVALFLVLRFALFVALVVIMFTTCCFTCCLVAVPYLGTVVLLPGLIYIRCFTLDCLAQFGPRYDVWTVDVPPAPTVPLIPPPPLG